VQAEHNSLRRDYLDQIRAGDRGAALELALTPLRDGTLALAPFYDDVLTPVAAKVGDLWHIGAISVAEEHFATAVHREAQQRARDLFEAAEPNGRVAVLACAPEEQHELGLQMAANVLRLAGYAVEMLGARVPARDLALFVGQRRPDVVLVSCTTPITIPGLIDAVRQVRACGVPVLVGGRAVRDYPAVAVAAEADAACPALADLVATVDELLTASAHPSR